jgi:hypothetical protein
MSGTRGAGGADGEGSRRRESRDPADRVGTRPRGAAARRSAADVATPEIGDARMQELLDWLTLREWMMVCLDLEVGEKRVAVMETQQSGRLIGRAFLTNRRLISARLTSDGVYMPHCVRALASVERVVTLPAEEIMLLLASPDDLDLIVRAKAPTVSAAEFERFAKLTRAAVAGVRRARDDAAAHVLARPGWLSTSCTRSSGPTHHTATRRRP